MTKWRDVLAAAGGPERAMLYGPALASLLHELKLTETDRDEWKRRCEDRDFDEESILQRMRQAQSDLLAERTALLEERTRREAAEAHALRVNNLVRVALNEHHEGVPSRKLAEAIAEYRKGVAT